MISIPFLAGDNAETLVCATANNFARLPPFIIACIGHMQDVTVSKAETAARQTTIPCWVILKQRSVAQQHPDILTPQKLIYHSINTAL